jgi:hypothetical protein
MCRRGGSADSHSALLLTVDKGKQNMEEQIFLSWSKEPSGEISKVIKNWIINIIPTATVFISKDISKGKEWGPEIKDALRNSFFGLIILTENNLKEPWLLWEAGAIHNRFESTRVSPLLIDIGNSKLDLPLSQMQSTLFEKEEFRNLAHALNNSMQKPFPSAFIDAQCHRIWEETRSAVELIISKNLSAKGQASKNSPTFAEIISILERHSGLLQAT